jgi:hypothetical protein
MGGTNLQRGRFRANGVSPPVPAVQVIQPDRVATLAARHVEGGPWHQVGHLLDEEPVRPHPHSSSLPWQRSSQAALSIDGDAAGCR